MKELNNYIVEKLNLDKDSNNSSDWSDLKNEIKREFTNDESKTTLKFLLNFIRRSKPGDFKSSVFNYWDMYINKNKLNCMHFGWSHDGVGHRKIAYVEKVIDNYNKDNGTKIEGGFAGWMADAGVPVLNIKEVVDALNAQFDNVDIKDKELVHIGL